MFVGSMSVHKSMKILYVGFKGTHNTSYQLVSSFPGEHLYLTNSFSGLARDIDALESDYDAVIMFGIDKSLSDSLRVERCAELHGDLLTTKLYADQLARGFRENGISCDISDTPTHYLCNDAYFKMLQKTNGKAVFVHIPGSRCMTQELMAGILKTLGE